MSLLLGRYSTPPEEGARPSVTELCAPSLCPVSLCITASADEEEKRKQSTEKRKLWVLGQKFRNME